MATTEDIDLTQPPTFLDNVQAAMLNLADERAATYSQLVAFTTGDPATLDNYSADEAAQIIWAAGKTHSDFVRDVDLHRKRMQWHEQLLEVRHVEADLDILRRQVADAQAKLRAAQDVYLEATEPLIADIGMREQQLADAAAAERQLLDTAAESLRLQHRQLECALTAAQRQHAHAVKNVELLLAHAATGQAQENIRDVITNAEAELPALEKQALRVEHQLRQLRADMLRP